MGDVRDVANQQGEFNDLQGDVNARAAFRNNAREPIRQTVETLHNIKRYVRDIEQNPIDAQAISTANLLQEDLEEISAAIAMYAAEEPEMRNIREHRGEIQLPFGLTKPYDFKFAEYQDKVDRLSNRIFRIKDDFRRAQRGQAKRKYTMGVDSFT